VSFSPEIGTSNRPISILGETAAAKTVEPGEAGERLMLGYRP
jgi:hypothetical protein